MMFFIKLLLVLILVFMMWRLFGFLKEKPEFLSKAALSKSFQTIGFLALFLIALVFVLRFFL